MRVAAMFNCGYFLCVITGALSEGVEEFLSLFSPLGFGFS